MIIKCGRREFTVTEKDRILDNGFCYLLITQYYFDSFARITPHVAKATFKQLQKEGKIKLCTKKYLGKFDLYQFVEV